MNVKWEQDADRLLQQRDRFTQQAIKREFHAMLEGADSPTAETIEFDTARQGFLTPVADGRYSVIWYHENGIAVVQAVVPTTRFSKEMVNLKERVRTVVRVESHGTVDVK